MRIKHLAWAMALAAAALAPLGADAATATFPKATSAGPPQFDDRDFLAEAVASPARAPENRARDPWRHPEESLVFWGLRPGDVILEIQPGGGYWTEILVPFVKAVGGRYIATGADLKDPTIPDRVRQSRAAFEAKYGVETVDFGPSSGPLAPPGTVDFILTARNLHDWMGRPGWVDKTLADAYAALKPGGVLAVEEHRADPRPMKPDAPDGYVSEQYVIAAAQKAGFRLDGRSEINANPKDSKDHPFGVWTLPPTRRSAPQGQPPDPSFDHAKYDAIGESDRMTLRFVKPR
ncbi:MAG: methyltransferase [Caulobacteraceae bacterium]